jgi:signal peptidase II
VRVASLSRRFAGVIDILLAGTAVLLLDQQSKRLVTSPNQPQIALGSVVRIRLVAARRTIYSSASARAALSFIWVAALVSALILQQSGAWFQSRAALFGVGIALGGAAGNLLDILRHRYVVDFIDFGWWPVFNLADVAIVGGLILALLLRA